MAERLQAQVAYDENDPSFMWRAVCPMTPEQFYERSDSATEEEERLAATTSNIIPFIRREPPDPLPAPGLPIVIEREAA